MSYPEDSSFVVPGQRLYDIDDKIFPGKGTYVRDDHIYSSLAGLVLHVKDDDSESMTVEVVKGNESVIMPTVGSIVTAKVINVRRKYIKCAIFCIEDTYLKEPFRGMVRREDVREKEKDKVEMHKCFRTGDIILARVKSTGTAQWYILSTAENELGVVLALSEYGSVMTPIGWTEMMCPSTFIKEPRKIAKVVPKNFVLKQEKV